MPEPRRPRPPSGSRACSPRRRHTIEREGRGDAARPAAARRRTRARRRNVRDAAASRSRGKRPRRAKCSRPWDWKIWNGKASPHANARGDQWMTDAETLRSARARFAAGSSRSMKTTIDADNTRRESREMKQEMLINVVAAGRMPDRDRRRRSAGRALHRAHQPGQLRRQHLQGQGRQSRAEHPGRLRRFRRRPQRLSAHQRRRAAILSPGRLRSRQADRVGGGRAARRRSSDDDDDDEDDDDPEVDERGRGRAAAAPRGPAPGRASSRRFRTSSAAATKCWCRSSRKASAPRARRSRPTSAFPAATWC